MHLSFKKWILTITFILLIIVLVLAPDVSTESSLLSKQKVLGERKGKPKKMKAKKQGEDEGKDGHQSSYI